MTEDAATQAALDELRPWRYAIDRVERAEFDRAYALVAATLAAAQADLTKARADATEAAAEQARIAELEKAVALANHHAEEAMVRHDTATRRAEQAEARERALREYVEHAFACADANSYHRDRPDACTCGLAALLAQEALDG